MTSVIFIDQDDSVTIDLMTCIKMDSCIKKRVMGQRIKLIVIATLLIQCFNPHRYILTSRSKWPWTQSSMLPTYLLAVCGPVICSSIPRKCSVSKGDEKKMARASGCVETLCTSFFCIKNISVVSNKREMLWLFVS